MIRWTPVCGPDPVRYRVKGFPFGIWIVNDTVTGCPGFSVVVGWNPASAGVRLDWFFSENPAFHLGPSLLTPLRNYDVLNRFRF